MPAAVPAASQSLARSQAGSGAQPHRLAQRAHEEYDQDAVNLLQQFDTAACEVAPTAPFEPQDHPERGYGTFLRDSSPPR